MAITKDAFVATLLESIGSARRQEQPYRHWFLQRCLPEDAVDPILDLPFPAPELGGVSGKRELHNATRKYFDVENRAKFPVCEAFCQAFQDKRVTDKIASVFGSKLAGSYLRVEYGQDTDSFWLEPHTDLGVKMFTMLLYMSKNPQHRTLGTDIYDQNKKHVGALAVRAQRGDGVRALRHHLPRLRAAPDRRRAQVGDHQLRHQRMARPRAAGLPRQADRGVRNRAGFTLRILLAPIRSGG